VDIAQRLNAVRGPGRGLGDEIGSQALTTNGLLHGRRSVRPGRNARDAHAHSSRLDDNSDTGDGEPAGTDEQIVDALDAAGRRTAALSMFCISSPSPAHITKNVVSTAPPMCAAGATS
jgi:hypothetical protein